MEQLQALFTDDINFLVLQRWGHGIQQWHTFLSHPSYVPANNAARLIAQCLLNKASEDSLFSHVGSVVATDSCKLHEVLTVGPYSCLLSRCLLQHVDKNGGPQ